MLNRGSMDSLQKLECRVSFLLFFRCAFSNMKQFENDTESVDVGSSYKRNMTKFGLLT